MAKSSYYCYQESTLRKPGKRDFHAERPNNKWLTDITEFAIPTGKINLSPVIDYFDGSVIDWTPGVTPDAVLANGMLDKDIELLKENEHPIIHSDRGCHYRWPGWIVLQTPLFVKDFSVD